MSKKSGVEFLGTILGLVVFLKYGKVPYLQGFQISEEFHFPQF